MLAVQTSDPRTQVNVIYVCWPAVIPDSEGRGEDPWNKWAS